MITSLNCFSILKGDLKNLISKVILFKVHMLISGIRTLTKNYFLIFSHPTRLPPCFNSRIFISTWMDGVGDIGREGVSIRHE
jgi:hypothetical protein